MKTKFDIDAYAELTGRVGFDPVNQALQEIVKILGEYHISFSDSGKLLSLADSLHTMKELGVPMNFVDNEGCAKKCEGKMRAIRSILGF